MYDYHGISLGFLIIVVENLSFAYHSEIWNLICSIFKKLIIFDEWLYMNEWMNEWMNKWMNEFY